MSKPTLLGELFSAEIWQPWIGVSVRRSTCVGAAAIVLSAVAFAIAAVQVKTLNGQLPPASLVFWRNAVSVSLVMMWFVAFGFPVLASAQRAHHVVRAVLTYAGLLAYFASVTSIPLSHAVLLRSASPVFIPIIAWLALRRRCDRNVWIGVLVGCAGIVCILQPGRLELSLGTSLGVASGVFGAAAAIAIWFLSDRDSAGTQLLYFSLTSVVLSMPAAILDWHAVPMEVYPIVLSIGFFTTLAQAFLLFGCRIAPAAEKVLAWNYSSVVFASIAGAVLWGEEIGGVALLGFAFVIAGSALTSSRRGSAASRSQIVARS